MACFIKKLNERESKSKKNHVGLSKPEKFWKFMDINFNFFSSIILENWNSKLASEVQERAENGVAKTDYYY